MPKNIVVLISGSGSNLQAIIDACATSRIPDARIILVFSNRKTAYGLKRASQATPPIPTDVLALQPYLKSHPDRTRTDYDLEIARRILNATVDKGEIIDLIVLAGWMHIMSGEILDVLTGARLYDTDSQSGKSKTVPKPIPIINLHPALPGAFDGSHAIERAFEAFRKGEVKNTGAMVHYVINEVDRGEPIVVREIEILPEDDLEALQTRIHGVEHDILVEAVIKVLEGHSNN